MTRLGRRAIGFVVLLGFLFVQIGASAAQIAYDSAGDSTYNNGFTQGSNGGYGWGGGWSLTQPPFAGLGDSTTNGGGDRYGIGDINSPKVTGGRAWALNGFVEDDATRPFAGPLDTGQTFSADYDNGFIGPDVPIDWMGLEAVSGTDGITFGHGNSTNTYQIFYSGTVINTLVPISYDGVHLAFTRGQAGYLVAVTPYGPGNLSVPPYVPGTTSFFNIPMDQPVDSVTFSISGDGSDNSNFTLFFNNIQITPEPAVAGLLAMAPVLLCRRRQRRGALSSRSHVDRVAW